MFAMVGLNLGLSIFQFFGFTYFFIPEVCVLGQPTNKKAMLEPANSIAPRPGLTR